MEDRLCHLCKNWLIKLKCPHLQNMPLKKNQQNYWFFHPSGPFTIAHFNVRHPVWHIFYKIATLLLITLTLVIWFANDWIFRTCFAFCLMGMSLGFMLCQARLWYLWLGWLTSVQYTLGDFRNISTISIFSQTWQNYEVLPKISLFWWLLEVFWSFFNIGWILAQ